MTQPYVGEIRMFAGNFAPAGWLLCNGDLLPISEYETLFTLIGTTYGGDGQTTFALPDLRGRAPVHQGQLAGGGNYVISQQSGAETVTLTTNQIAAHNHTAAANSAPGTANSPSGAHWAADPTVKQYTPGTNASGTMNAAAAGPAGGGQPHDNMLPFLAVNFIISLFGIYPSQT